MLTAHSLFVVFVRAGVVWTRSGDPCGRPGVGLITIPPEHITKMIDQGEQLMPIVRKIPMRARMAVARPLIVKNDVDERNVSRTFECFDHAYDGVDGFVTISGGKTTTARAMAEHVSDMVCNKLGITAECRTREVLLASYRLFFQGGQQ